MGEAYNGEISFADSLEVFGGGQDDPVSVSIGGCWNLFSYVVLLSLLFPKHKLWHGHHYMCVCQMKLNVNDIAKN